MKDFMNDERDNSLENEKSAIDNTDGDMQNKKDSAVNEDGDMIQADNNAENATSDLSAKPESESAGSSDSTESVPEKHSYTYSSDSTENNVTESENTDKARFDDSQKSDSPYFNNLSMKNTPKDDSKNYNSTLYNIPQMNGNGQISYTPASPDKSKKKNKKSGGKAAGIAVLCIFGLLLSCGAGFFGAYLANEYTDNGSLSESGESYGGPTIYKSPDTTQTSSDSDKVSYSGIVEAVSDTVVEISTEYQNFGWYQYVTEGAGSGVIISEDGYIITNNHVICGTDSSTIADTITVRMKNGDEYKAEVIGSDSDADIAVIKIDATDLPCAVFGDSDNLAVGEEVIAIGNPLGQLGGTVTNGIISALAREVNVGGVTMNLLQTNTAINPGNSGGGLFNMKGELVGIVNAKSSGTGIEGLGFAIPSNDALETSKQLLEYGYVKGKPMIGVTLYDVTDASKAKYIGVNALGVYITKTVEGYNDDVLEVGDRIVAVNDIEITSGNDVIKIVKSSSVGDVLKFVLYRDGKLITVDVKCYESGEDLSGEQTENG